ncbi:hypothetical protein V2J09_007629 [Rumex salicifolius]
MDSSVNGAYRSPFASLRHVTYSCGSCGYDLSLSSSNRNTGKIGSKYNKSIKRGIISFFQIDESRFTQVDEIHCIPYFDSKNSWGLLRKKTKLLCRKCGNHVGDAYEIRGTDGSDCGTDANGKKESVGCRKYEIRIRKLQPSSTAVHHGNGTPLCA